MLKSNVLTMAHIIQGAEWGPRPTSRCSPLVVKVPWTTPLSAWCLWENQWLKINLDPSKKWMFTGTYPSVNRFSMDTDMEHPQFLGHQGNPWISTAISKYKLSLYPLLTDQYTTFDGVSWFGHYSVIFGLLHLLCAPTNAMLWCYKVDICLISCEMDALASVHWNYTFLKGCNTCHCFGCDIYVEFKYQLNPDYFTLTWYTQY